jgi:flavin reductase (DIM6/NTAB) family NADH-FMN oxidoreductase RutF
MAVDLDTFKRAAGSWVSGVTIVTSRTGGRQHGMIVTAFCSVSADPPQVLVCANRGSGTRAVIDEASAFTVNVLAEEQTDLLEIFSGEGREENRFEGLDCTLGVTGCPRIPDALAYLDCSVAQVVESGTHDIYIGLVEAAEVSDLRPLAYFRRKCRRLET